MPFFTGNDIYKGLVVDEVTEHGIMGTSSYSLKLHIDGYIAADTEINIEIIGLSNLAAPTRTVYPGMQHQFTLTAI